MSENHNDGHYSMCFIQGNTKAARHLSHIPGIQLTFLNSLHGRVIYIYCQVSVVQIHFSCYTVFLLFYTAQELVHCLGFCPGNFVLYVGTYRFVAITELQT